MFQSGHYITQLNLTEWTLQAEGLSHKYETREEVSASEGHYRLLGKGASYNKVSFIIVADGLVQQNFLAIINIKKRLMHRINRVYFWRVFGNTLKIITC